MISFACPHCRAKLRCEESKAGRNLPCPGCRLSVQVPLPPVLDYPAHASEPVPVIQQPMLLPIMAAGNPASVNCMCRYCQTVVTLDSRWLGMQVVCPSCQTPLDVPVPASPPPVQPITVNVLNAATAAMDVSAPVPEPEPEEIIATPRRNRSSGGAVSCGMLALLAAVLLGGAGVVGLVYFVVSEAERTQPSAGPPKSPASLVGVWEDPGSRDQIHMSTDGSLTLRAFGNGEIVAMDGNWTYSLGELRNLLFTVRQRGSLDEPVLLRWHAEFGNAGELKLTSVQGRTISYVRIK